MKLEFEVEMSKELMNEGNRHDHWAELYRRNQSRKHRLISIRPVILENRNKLQYPIKIKLIRIGPRFCDSDNWITTAKSFRDAVADLLIHGLAPGQADGDIRLQWGYAQIKGPEKYYALRIEIEG